MQLDIAAVVNLHREGKTATPSIISAWRAVQAARAHGLSANLVLVLDSADSPTRAIADDWVAREAHIVTVDHGDLGRARNAAVEAVDATWIAFLDADDLWGQEWLWRAHDAALSIPAGGTPQVWHPTTNIIFGDHHSLLHHQDSDDPSFRWSRLRLHNGWTALSFAERDTLMTFPYPENDLTSGFGFEDWSWNITVLANGGRHRVVPDTCHFVRRTNAESLLGRSQAALRSRSTLPSVPPWREPNVALSDRGDAIDAHTHREVPVSLSASILAQVRLAATIEPEVEHTLRPDGSPRVLPQNFNTHTTAGHRALDQLERESVADGDLSRTIGELVEACAPLATLDADSRTRVVAEFALEERQLGRREGSSPILDETYAAFPQVRA